MDRRANFKCSTYSPTVQHDAIQFKYNTIQKQKRIIRQITRQMIIIFFFQFV